MKKGKIEIMGKKNTMSNKYHYGKFPPKKINQEELRDVISRARTELGRYDGLLTAMDNADVLLAPLFEQEAVLSSRIEGTQSSVSEVLSFEAKADIKKFSPKKENDIKEVINYRHAIQKAIKLLDKYPLSQRIILESHKILMRGVRGEGKSPGMYRSIPNWIGSDKKDMKDARFIPIDANKIPDAMSRWEKYIHEKNNPLDDLVKIAILHAEFEALHPFLDGNGRLGRMFIPLFLWDKKLIKRPSFYISAYFERNRQSYFDMLLNVSAKGEWTQWCYFFLQGIAEESKNNFNKAKEILRLYGNLKNRIPMITKSQYGIVSLDYIFNTPIFNSSQFYQNGNIPKPTAQRLLQVLNKEKILKRIAGKGSKPSIHYFHDLIKIVDT